MMDRVKFENLVDQAIRDLPAEFRKKLENVVVIVEDRPSEEFLNDMEITSGDTLFGLYEGTPLTERGFDTIFSRQVEAFGNPGDVLIVFSTSGKLIRRLGTGGTLDSPWAMLKAPGRAEQRLPCR